MRKMLVIDRQYQLDSINAVDAGFERFDRLLGVAPTGAGKTIMFSMLADRWQKCGERTMIIAHREELIEQAIAKLHKATGIFADKEKAESFARMTSPVVVASIQTLNRRVARWPRDHFSKIIIDECHHVLSPMYQRPLSQFSAKVLGVTATPDRGDKRNLGEYFQDIAFEIGLFDLINQGFLSRIKLKSIPLEIDLSAVGQKAGDFDQSELGNALEPYLDQIAAAIRSEAAFRKTLAFLPLIATSQKFVVACKNAGLAACHVDGESPDRADTLGRFARGEFDVLSNAMLLTEGYDDPSIDCVVVLRPTRSRPLYAQMVGRGTRIHECKEDLLLLDFLWNHKKHAICRPANLIAKSQEEAEAMTALAERAAAMPGDIAAQLPLDLQALNTETQQKREEALRKRLEENRKKKAKFVSAEDFAMEHNSPDLADYQPTMKWESLAITPAQLVALERAKIDIGTVRGKGHANKLLDVVYRDQPLRLASASAAARMRQMPWICAELGIHDLTAPTSAQAGRFFAKLRARNGVEA